jgi:hypothetical protein
MILSACATASVSYSDVAPGAQAVSAEASKFNFLGFTPTPIETLYALRDDLRQQCGGRSVTGIVSRSSTIFAIIGFVEKTEVSGYCAQP